MSNNDAADLIFWHISMQHETKRHQDPRQIGGRKDEQPQKAQPSFRVAAGPDINQTAAERRAKKWYGEERGQAEEDGYGVEE